MSESGEHYPISAQLRFYCTNNMFEYEACILGLRLVVDMGIQELLVLGDSDLLVHQIQGEWETETQSSYHINIVYKVFVNDSCR